MLLLCPYCDADRMPDGYGGPLIHEGHFSVRDWRQASEVESVTLNDREMLGQGIGVTECLAGTEGWIVYRRNLNASLAFTLEMCCEHCHESTVYVEHGDVRVTMRPRLVRR